MKILTAEFVLPISSGPIENGAVILDEDRLVYVGPRSEIHAGLVPLRSRSGAGRDLDRIGKLSLTS